MNKLKTLLLAMLIGTAFATPTVFVAGCGSTQTVVDDDGDNEDNDNDQQDNDGDDD